VACLGIGDGSWLADNDEEPRLPGYSSKLKILENQENRFRGSETSRRETFTPGGRAAATRREASLPAAPALEIPTN
jgi:hypothetical protein